MTTSLHRRVQTLLPFSAALAILGSVVALAGPWSFSPMHHANVAGFEQNIQKVARFCGPTTAQAFRAAYDPDDDTTRPAAEWISECATPSER